MPSIYFELCGAPIIITSRASRLIAIFADYFRYYHPQHPSPTVIEHPLNIELKIRRTLPPPEQLIPRSATLLAHAGPIRMWHESGAHCLRERFYFYTDRVAFRVEPECGRMIGLITPQMFASPHLLANTYALFPLLLLLRTRGIYHLHAAAVLSPRDELYLICGAQHSGKTTLTTALGLAGWRPISDDSLLLRAHQSELQLFALKKNFHLSDDVLARWPSLNSIERHYHYFTRTSTAGLEFFKTTLLADQAFNQATCIVLPQITGEALSSLEPLSASQVILKLAEESMFFQLWSHHTQQQLKLLTQLAGAASGYRLLAGKDLLAEPMKAAQVLTMTADHRTAGQG